nr:HAMP domain-containing sensor histidine kinase [Salsipaludibacter albus]
MAVALVDGGPDTVRTALALGPVADAGEVTVVLPDGTTVGAGPIPNDVLARAQAGQGARVPVPGGIALVTPIGGADDISVVQVVVPEDRLGAGVAASWAVIGLLGLALVVGATLFADRLALRITRPVAGVAAAARELTTGRRDTRAPVDGPPEIADVATALNGLADAIDDLLTAEREGAADLSHRLRTPLTALRLDLEAMGDAPGIDRLAADLARLEAAVDQMIRQARAGAAGRGPADLAAVVRGRLDYWGPLAEDEGRAVTADVTTVPVVVGVSADDLAAAVDALVVNVLRHTPAATAFTVTVAAEADGAVLTVDDAGPGFASDLVERGRSGDGSTGLGLDICRRLAEEAGGRVVLGTPDAGVGARVELVLPRHSPR